MTVDELLISYVATMRPRWREHGDKLALELKEHASVGDGYVGRDGDDVTIDMHISVEELGAIVMSVALACKG